MIYEAQPGQTLDEAAAAAWAAGADEMSHDGMLYMYRREQDHGFGDITIKERQMAEIKTPEDKLDFWIGTFTRLGFQILCIRRLGVCIQLPVALKGRTLAKVLREISKEFWEYAKFLDAEAGPEAPEVPTAEAEIEAAAGSAPPAPGRTAIG